MQEDTWRYYPRPLKYYLSVAGALFSSYLLHRALCIARQQQCVLMNARIHIHVVRPQHNAVSILHLREQPRSVIISSCET